ncbi:MAG TPA: queuosine precursor transporter [Gammaproteobacteria bacterium]|nr:queuosine precursor transporter [Gammaproteobacteria bacterium]
MSMIKEELKLPRYLNLLSMIYAVIFISSVVMAHKIILLSDNIVISVSAFIIPITYVFLDAIAEVYGYDAARKIIWSTLFCELIFAVICSSLLLLPSPPQIDNQAAYQIVVGSLLRTFVGSFLGVVSGSFLNIFLISKLKIKYKGGFFILRCILSSMLGELIFTIVSICIIFIGTMPLVEVLQLIYTSYLVKLIFSVISVFPVSFLVMYLKRNEATDIYKSGVSFNPFKLESK